MYCTVMYMYHTVHVHILYGTCTCTCTFYMYHTTVALKVAQCDDVQCDGKNVQCNGNPECAMQRNNVQCDGNDVQCDDLRWSRNVTITINADVQLATEVL